MGLLDIGTSHHTHIHADPRVGYALESIAESQNVQTDVRAADLYHAIREKVIHELAFSRLEFPKNCPVEINATTVYDASTDKKTLFYKAVINGKLIQGTIPDPTPVGGVPNIYVLQEVLRRAFENFITDMALAIAPNGRD